MMKDIKIIDFNTLAYLEALKLQEIYFEKVLEEKNNCEGHRTEFLLIGEHNPVITIGRRGKDSNILIPEKSLHDKGIGIYKITRGGDVTYHCPGQLMVYPILDLELHRIRVKDYVYLLEESIITLLSNYGIKGEREAGATGVWIGKGLEKERKICAIGVKCSRFCTMHGLALNVNADLDGFSFINPCGFTDKGVTSMNLELDRKINMQDIKKEFSDIFLSLIFSL